MTVVEPNGNSYELELYAEFGDKFLPPDTIHLPKWTSCGPQLMADPSAELNGSDLDAACSWFVDGVPIPLESPLKEVDGSIYPEWPYGDNMDGTQYRLLGQTDDERRVLEQRQLTRARKRYRRHQMAKRNLARRFQL